MEKVILAGSGGFCSAVIDSIKSQGKYEILGILDLPSCQGNEICGIKVIGTDDDLKKFYDLGIKNYFVTVGSIGNYQTRKKLVNMAKKIGFNLISVIDKSANVSEYASLGEMVYVGKNAVINPNTVIGDYTIINTGAIVEHGTSIGEYAHVAPGACLAGDISVGYGTHVGLNASIIQGAKIGNDCMIGMGSVVLRNVNDNEKVYGIVK